MPRDGCRWSAWVALLAVVVLTTTGCVKRRMTIRTDPPGALVSVNGEELGPSPVSKSFTYYGDREVELVADGYERRRLVQPTPPPWWNNALTEFVTENLIPLTLRDEREFFYQLQPASTPPQTDVARRAEALRAQAQSRPPDPPPGLFEGLFSN
ncbi:PEGA domain protein [Isosphaera pallida ATCC 43644]|uniref:PEGA domain protein n=1 Tax=Isosphaera pallida (strain ATCC 43644 / DSM 9630 / IS1B) TaxID=575540 RepID=E8R6I0_ISOPI|nr:PEGA domain-containing protein [Isosphaera pallida]ADV62891.1 PEGA domain protein [Isosphaera pallida ATCC 43644]